jgi:replicative DNA helicase
VTFQNIPENETEFLGLILQSPPSLNAYRMQVPAEAFTNELTRRIWEGMCQLGKAGTEVSIPALREAVKVDVDRYEIPSLPSFLMSCMQQAKGDLGLDDLAGILCERALKASLNDYAGQLLKELNEGRASGEELALKGAEMLSNLAAARRPTVGVSMHDAGRAFMDQLTQAQKDGEARGHDWGIRTLDDLMGRIVMGDFGLIIGPSGHGKSAMARGLAKHIAMREPTLTISAEETPEDIAAKDLIAQTGVDSQAVEQVSINLAETEALVLANQAQKDLPAFFEYTDDMRISNIEALIRAFKHRHGACGAVFVDTIDDVNPEVRGSHSMPENVALVCRALDRLSTKLRVPIIGLGQVKTSYNERPDISLRLSDSYGGQAVRNKASWVLLMHRPQKKIGDTLIKGANGDRERDKWKAAYEEWRDLGEVICAKRRRGRDGGIRKIGWSGPRTTFHDLDEDIDQGDMW